MGLIVYVLGPSSSNSVSMIACAPRLPIFPINAHLETRGQKVIEKAEKMWPEALPPLIIIASCIAVTGMGLAVLDRWQHGGKVHRERLVLIHWVGGRLLE